MASQKFMSKLMFAGPANDDSMCTVLNPHDILLQTRIHGSRMHLRGVTKHEIGPLDNQAIYDACDHQKFEIRKS
jgi:hypothetical protein